MHDALAELATKQKQKAGAAHYLLGQIAAISVGIVKGQVEVDLDYAKDSTAEVDMNLVMRCPLGGGPGDFVEVQGTGEHGVFPRAKLDELLVAGTAAIDELFTLQRTALG